jgi:acyl dehydratase
MDEQQLQYLEDLAPGQRYRSATRITVSAADSVDFARQFDPQPFHLDEEAARGSVFGRLAASGWHTAALTMRLLVDSAFRPAGGIIGAGMDELRWPRPVFPGDDLHLETEILEVRPSRSRPEQGLVKARTTTFNGRDEPVQVLVANLIVPRRLHQQREERPSTNSSRQAP